MMHSQYENWRVDYKFHLSVLIEVLEAPHAWLKSFGRPSGESVSNKFSVGVPAKLSPAP